MYCRYCGASNRDNDEFCQKCGKRIKIKKIIDKAKKSKLKIGWMVWWRAMLPIEVGISIVTWNRETNYALATLAALPFLLFLLNWAGRVVARKHYNFDTPRFIGWSILWKTAIVSIPVRFPFLAFCSFASRSENIFLLFAILLLLPLYILLMIIILGAVTKQTIGMINTIKISEEEMALQEAVEYLGLSEVTLYKLLNSGQIPAKKIGHQWRVSKVALDRFLAEGKVSRKQAKKE